MLNSGAFEAAGFPVACQAPLLDSSPSLPGFLALETQTCLQTLWGAGGKWSLPLLQVLSYSQKPPAHRTPWWDLGAYRGERPCDLGRALVGGPGVLMARRGDCSGFRMRAPPALARSEERKTRHRVGLDSGAAFGGNTIPPVEPPEGRERPMSTFLSCLTNALQQPWGRLATLQPFASWLCPEVLSGPSQSGGKQHRGLQIRDSPACTL